MADLLRDIIRRYVISSGIPEQLMAAGLLGYDEKINLIGQYTRANGGWVLGADPEGRPFRDVETFGVCAVVLFVSDEWTTPATFRTTQYPRLHLQVWADQTRDADGNPLGEHDAEDKAWTVWRALHPLFHDAANKVRYFDTLRVLSTTQGGTWSSMGVPDTDGVIRGDCTYNLQLD